MTTYEIAPWPRAEHFARVFKIRSGTQLGTATAIDIDRRQYLVTALHVVEHALDVLCVDVRLNEEWISHPFGLVAAYPEADIAIFALQRRLTLSEYPIDISASGCIAGQEVFFLGYPLGIQGHLVEPGFPLPVVKRAQQHSLSLHCPTGAFSCQVAPILGSLEGLCISAITRRARQI